MREDANIARLCRRFGVSRQTGYKWIGRFVARGPGDGAAALIDRSRRPHRSPARTDEAVERQVAALRAEHPAWGPRKLRRVLLDRELLDDERTAPSPSTIGQILRRRGLIDADASPKHRPFVRFERAHPNELWQMDFKGHFALPVGRCHPLGVLDDHSRYALGLEACADEQEATVRGRLTAIFRRYGLPWQMLMDNGPPWGDAGDQPYTALSVWLMWLGVRVTHGRPRHPQTQGKQERFHRTLNAELLQGHSLRDLPECQCAFDRWRQIYNHDRPHEALDLATPGERYRPSPRSFPEQLPPIEYASTDHVRKSTRWAGSASGTAECTSARRSVACMSLCGRPARTASSACTSASITSTHWTCARRPPVAPRPSLTLRPRSNGPTSHEIQIAREPEMPDCNLCLRTPVTHVPGTYTGEGCVALARPSRA